MQLFLDPTDDRPAVLTGRVHLRLSSARSNVKLSVRFVGRATVLEVQRTLSDVSLDLGEGRTFAAGDNDIDFSISVPQQAAPTEGCPYGVIQHFLEATAQGLGTLGSDLRFEQEIECVPSYFSSIVRRAHAWRVDGHAVRSQLTLQLPRKSRRSGPPAWTRSPHRRLRARTRRCRDRSVRGKAFNRNDGARRRPPTRSAAGADA